MKTDLTLPTEVELQIMRDEGARRFRQRMEEAEETLEKKKKENIKKLRRKNGRKAN